MTTTTEPQRLIGKTDKVWCTNLGKFKYVGVCANCKGRQRCRDYQNYLSPRIV